MCCDCIEAVTSFFPPLKGLISFPMHTQQQMCISSSTCAVKLSFSIRYYYYFGLDTKSLPNRLMQGPTIQFPYWYGFYFPFFFWISFLILFYEEFVHSNVHFDPQTGQYYVLFQCELWTSMHLLAEIPRILFNLFGWTFVFFSFLLLGILLNETLSLSKRIQRPQ